MADERRTQFYPDGDDTWLPGLHDYQSPEKVVQGGLSRAQEVTVADTGTIQRRKGLIQHREYRSTGSPLPTSAQPLLLAGFRFQESPAFLLGISQISSTTCSAFIDDGTASGLREILLPVRYTDRVQAVRLLDRVYLFEEGLTPLYWEWGNAEFKAEPGGQESIPQGTCAAYFKARAWVGDKSLLYFSDALGTTGSTGEVLANRFGWDQINFAFRTRTGDIVALQPFRNFSLVAFTDRGIETFEVNDCDILSTVRLTISDTIGCSGPHTVVMAGEQIYFQDHEGHLRNLAQTQLDESQGVTDVPMSLPIQRWVDRQTKDYLYRSRVVHHHGRLFWSMPLDGAQFPNAVFAYSLKTKAWEGPWYFQGEQNPLRILGLTNFRFLADRERIYAFTKLSDGSAVVAKVLEGSDDLGTAIALDAQTRGYSGKMRASRKRWNHMTIGTRYVDGSDGSTVALTVEGRGDRGAWVSLGSFTLQRTNTVTFPVTFPVAFPENVREVRKVPLDDVGRARSFQARLKASDANDGNWELEELFLSYQEEAVEFLDNYDAE